MSETNTMTVAEAKERKLQLELMIGDMLMNFQKQTGHYVERINVEPIDVMAAQNKHPEIVAYRVEIDAKL